MAAQYSIFISLLHMFKATAVIADPHNCVHPHLLIVLLV
jgi:hypothetical protein